MESYTEDEKDIEKEMEAKTNEGKRDEVSR